MKRNLFFLPVFSALLLVGCNSEEKFKDSASLEECHILKATLEDLTQDSRVGFIIPGGKFFWSAEDMLGVDVTNRNGTKSIKNFSLQHGEGLNFARFRGITQIGETMGHYAIFPFYKRFRHKFSATELTFRFPTEYVYAKVDQRFPGKDMSIAELAEMNGFNPAMAGIIENMQIQLKHLGGTICVLVDKMPYASGTLYFTTDNKITGDYSMPLEKIKTIGSAGNNGFVVVAASEAKEKTVSIKFFNAEVGKPGHFYIPAPTGKYTGYSVGLDSNNDLKMEVVYVSKEGFEVKRTYTKLLKPQDHSNVNPDGWDVGIDGWINEDIDYGGTVG